MLSSLPYLSSQAALSGEDLKLGTGFTINQNVCDLKGEGDWGGGGVTEPLGLCFLNSNIGGLDSIGPICLHDSVNF